MQHKEYDPHKSAILIKGVMAIRGLKQKAFAQKIGMNRVLLNMFLNRHINFIDEDIKTLFDALEIDESQREKAFRASCVS